MISLASAFLYALLSDRVLLVHPEAITSDLFCEPFPGGSWWLPLDFPLLDKFKNFTKSSNDSFGELLRKNTSSPLRQPYVYLHVNQDCGDYDKRFYCEEGQLFIQDVSWLIMMSNQYFVPPFFSMAQYDQELQNLFPDKATVFHLLGRYLFHPTNSVWGFVRRFYDGYLSEADVKVGIQIRIYHYDQITFPFVADQVLSCTMSEGILSRVYEEPNENSTGTLMKKKDKKKIAVLMTSLNQEPFQQLRKLYLENQTVTGDTITIHQPSFEGHQNTGDHNHDKKALAEIYLLSLTDKLLTSEKSTFGYVAQGLGGLKPWVIFMWKNETGHGRECSRAVSMEPCMHIPPRFNCKTRQTIGKNVNKPFVRDCEDWHGGVQIVGDYNNTS